jgi:hypothetical protein
MGFAALYPSYGDTCQVSRASRPLRRRSGSQGHPGLRIWVSEAQLRDGEGPVDSPVSVPQRTLAPWPDSRSWPSGLRSPGRGRSQRHLQSGRRRVGLLCCRGGASASRGIRSGGFLLVRERMVLAQWADVKWRGDVWSRCRCRCRCRCRVYDTREYSPAPRRFAARSRSRLRQRPRGKSDSGHRLRPSRRYQTGSSR